MVPTRRALLSGLAVTLAGCSSNSSGSPTPRTTTAGETTTEPTTATPEPPTGTPTEPQQPEHVRLDDERVPWRVDFPGDRIVKPSASGDHLFVATGSSLAGTPRTGEESVGHLAALSHPDGEIEWHRELDDAPTSDVHVHRDSVYLPIGQSTGLQGVSQRLVRVETDGTIRWQSPTRDAFLRPYGFDAEAAYLGTADDHLQPAGETTFAVSLETGTEQWAVEGGDASDGRVADETLYADYGGLAIASLRTSDGSTRWQRRVEALHGHERPLPTAAGHLFAAIEGQDSYGIAGIDATDGSTSWTHGLDAASPFVVTSATAVGDAVVATEFDGLLFARDAATGEARWRQEYGDKLHAPLEWEGVLYCSVLDGPVVAVDADSGAELWRTDVAGEGDAQLSLAGDTLLVGSRNGRETSIEARRVSDGGLRWRRSIPGPAVAFETVGNMLAVATETQSVYGITLD
ncbi:MAG: PQQ-binding-like beta-propeller repeat protein [Halolamina sp.]|uniref:PQQ-binding-like beta-propeller repeat protein n=1 Tax=Halolamina sp. TaxID=1940283 RepID=UPI002FC39F7A